MIFKPFPKIPRLSRDIIITEKIDGTNAQIIIEHKDILATENPDYNKDLILAEKDDLIMFAGSRTKYIKPGDDNYGFAGWVQKNAEELFKLGIGQHFGEWWGSGIQRTYGLSEKRFSLFNTSRWMAPYKAILEGHDVKGFPVCCHVVPPLYQGTFDDKEIRGCIDLLRVFGSKAAPGFMTPEGIVVFHSASSTMFKKTLDKDEKAKGEQ